VPTVANPWRAYWTSVNPGSGIDFVTARLGWRLDGQIWGPRIDGNLGAGVVDNGSAWPGTSISETTNGGTTWRTILSVGSGIWGLDFVSAEVGFAVEVTSVSRTNDGGEHWQQIAEPAGHPLVWVDFATSAVGYGLTTTGQLVMTVNAGSSWTSTRFPAPGTAACFVSGQAGDAIDSSGALYATHDGGRTWVVAVAAASRPAQFIGPWSDLACQGANIEVGQQLLCAAACAATSPYLVGQSGDGGASWSKMASDWSVGAAAPAPTGSLAAVAVGGPNRGVIVELPTDNSPAATKRQLRIFLVHTPAGTYAAATVPALPGSSTGGDVEVRGMTFLGSTGWLYFDDTDAGSPGSQRAEPVVWKTTDGGLSWRVAAAGPLTRPPGVSS
jgi:hypothetical protein